MAKGEKISLRAAQRVAKALKKDLDPFVQRIEFVGSLRRKSPLIGDLDVVVICKPAAWTILSSVPGVKLHESGNTRASGTYRGLQVNLWRTTTESWGSALFRLTGPKGYVIGYCSRARKLGLKLCDTGVFRGEERIAGKTERGVYKALGKSYKAPEER